MVSPQKEQLEAAALQEEMDQNEADLEAIHKILSSPFVQRDAMRESGDLQLPSITEFVLVTGCSCLTCSVWPCHLSRCGMRLLESGT